VNSLVLGILAAGSLQLNCGDIDGEGLDADTAAAVSQGVEQYRSEGASPGAAGLLGMVLHANGLTEAAATCYRRAGLGEPGDARWAYLAGVVAEIGGRPDQAIDSYWATLRAQPDYAPAVVRLAALLRESGDIVAAGLVLARFDRPDATPAMRAALGEQALAADEPVRAERLLRSALDEEPKADRLYYLLARALQAQGKDSAAREALERRGSVGLTPADPILALVDELEASEVQATLVGRRAFRAGHYEAAREAFAEALARNPGSVTARVNLATTLGALGRADEARILFEETLEIEPDNRAALFNLAALDESVTPARAAERYRRLVELEPTDAEAQYRLGVVLAQLGQVDEALVALERARTDLAYFAPGALLAVRLLVADGQEARAQDLLERSRQVAPADPALAATQISLWTTSRDPAVRNGPAALDLAQRRFDALGDSESARLLAQAHAELNQCDEAKTWLTRAAELEPSEPLSGQLLTASQSLGTPCRRPTADVPAPDRVPD
jgi:tetratricopeptide (TPR) repeat protein